MKKIIIYILIIVVIFSTGAFLSFKLFENYHNTSEKIITNELKMLTSSVNLSFRNYFKNTRIKLELIASLFKSEKLTFSEKLKELYNKYIKNDNYIINIFFVNNKGIVKDIDPSIYSNIIGITFPINKYFKNYEKYDTSLYSYHNTNKNLIKNNSNKNLVLALLPIYSKDSKFHGLLGININISRMVSDLEKTVNIDNSANALNEVKLYFIDYEKDCIIGDSSHKNDLELNKLIIKSSNKNRNKNTSGYFDFKNSRYIYSFHSIDQSKYKFRIFGYVPYSLTSGYIKEFTAQLAWILILGCIILLFIIIVIVSYEIMIKKLRHHIVKLNINMDTEAEKKDVSKIVDSEYFDTIAETVRKLKEKKK